ncbi:sigma-70 family RNA polymerase sigma factor [Kitasatospora sp. NBC_00315]|uniref:sigma-70 family RNA polymerase sigma factor n=1 Tax=Kitasatospora sp. NBC_00315 TaxID=2975963 RepID=UPI00352E7C24
MTAPGSVPAPSGSELPRPDGSRADDTPPDDSRPDDSRADDSPPDDSRRWDVRLARRLARGEETALGELYDRLSPLVHGLAGRILSDQAAAEQLTREVFADLWSHPEAFDPEQGSLRSWLGALTHRRALDRLRRSTERSALPGARTGALDEEIRAVATAAHVQYVVDSLPRPLRETIAESYDDGRTYQETARRLGISEQAAKQRMRLGLQLLATELDAGTAAETTTETTTEAETVVVDSVARAAGGTTGDGDRVVAPTARRAAQGSAP